jgi:aspartyl-tRNA(Asn)/glutamyl-tRNA(Gln) amidotransferase subunit B
MAHPGTLPVPNKQAIENVVRVGLAVGGKIANFSEFDRKNYFYPDIPKGYQISQYKYPIVSGGEIAGVKLTRIHLEEDTASAAHHGVGGPLGKVTEQYSLINFNRAGVPLMELVTEPVIHDAETAMRFAKEFRLLLQTLGVSHGNLEKGEMRVELNISISPDPTKFGTKVEVKNIGSFSAVGKAAAFEIDRMIDLYESGRQDEIVQETRGWDDVKQGTYSQRKKENSNDYRYFPDPDISKFYLHEMFNLEELKKNLPELPWQKRARYQKDFGIKDEDIESYVNDSTLGNFFEQVSNILKNPESIKIASNYITSDMVGLLSKDSNLKMPSVETFAKLIQMNADAKLNSRGTKDILAMILATDSDPEIIANEKGLIQQNDEGTLRTVAQKVVDANPSVVAEYKSGKEALLMFFVGQIMKETKGSANPALVQSILKELLK